MAKKDKDKKKKHQSDYKDNKKKSGKGGSSKKDTRREGKNGFKIPDKVNEFIEFDWKKEKKKLKKHDYSKKEAKIYASDNFVSLLLGDNAALEFVLRYGYRQEDVRNEIYAQIANAENKKLIQYIAKLQDKGELEQFGASNLLPIALFDIIAEANRLNKEIKANNPEDTTYNVDDLYALSNALLKKSIKKATKKGIDEDLAFDLLSVIPCKDALKYSKEFRYRTVLNVLYLHAQKKEIDFKKVVELLFSASDYTNLILTALLERKERIERFNEKQKVFFNDITEWVLNELEDMERASIVDVLETYVNRRKKDAERGRDGNRRYYISSLPSSSYPNITKAVDKVIKNDEDAKKYL